MCKQKSVYIEHFYFSFVPQFRWKFIKIEGSKFYLIFFVNLQIFLFFSSTELWNTLEKPKKISLDPFFWINKRIDWSNCNQVLFNSTGWHHWSFLSITTSHVHQNTNIELNKILGLCIIYITNQIKSNVFLIINGNKKKKKTYPFGSLIVNNINFEYSKGDRGNSYLKWNLTGVHTCTSMIHVLVFKVAYP